MSVIYDQQQPTHFFKYSSSVLVKKSYEESVIFYNHTQVTYLKTRIMNADLLMPVSTTTHEHDQTSGLDATDEIEV